MLTPYISESGEEIHLCELLGDISQDFLACSYNEDEIRGMWRTGTLNEWAKDSAPNYSSQSAVTQLAKAYGCTDGNWQRLLSQVVQHYQGWSVDYDHCKVSPLTAADRAAIDRDLTT
jgi:hypothetical protein